MAGGAKARGATAKKIGEESPGMKKRFTLERTFRIELAESELVLVIGQLLKCSQEKREPLEKEESARHEQARVATAEKAHGLAERLARIGAAP